MLMSLPLFAAIAVVAVGALVLGANRYRWVNRMVFSCSIHIAVWLFFLHLAMRTPEGLSWLRLATSISASIPFHFWLVKEAIASDFKARLTIFRRLLVWIVITVVLVVIPFTDYFIPSHSTGDRRVYGQGYYVYIIGVLGLYLALGGAMLRRLRTLSGGRRLALQVWLGGGCAAAATILLLMMLNAAMGSNIHLQPIVVLVYYSATAYAITTHRIFDARQLLLMVGGKSVLVMLVAGIAWLLFFASGASLPVPLALMVTTGIALWFAAAVNRRLDRLFHFLPEGTAARQAALAASQREPRIESLEAQFRSILRGWGQSDHALILSGTKDQLVGGGIELPINGAAIQELKTLRWVTPERLARERPNAGRVALQDVMAKNDLEVLVIEDGQVLVVVVGVGPSASRRPFTYPQVTQLRELGSIMVSALERAHFSTKAQHAEQLATVGLLGASIAHEIRNPLVSIKTFVQLLPTHHHDPKFREKFFRLIGDEVGRIDQLTEQLLDLASPRTYAAAMLELHPILRASLELVAAKAAHKQVQFLAEFRADPDVAFTDASAAKQVMLNLCFNAIQAVETQQAERWVKVTTRNTPEGIEMIVADSGPGISDQIRPFLFQPFQTTKSTGFGLGLAICSDILANLNASITVDPPQPGQGATFRVTFPCQPLSS